MKTILTSVTTVRPVVSINMILLVVVLAFLVPLSEAWVLVERSISSRSSISSSIRTPSALASRIQRDSVPYDRRRSLLLQPKRHETAKSVSENTTTTITATTTIPDSATSSSSAASWDLNPLLSTIQPSATVQIFSMVKQMQADGHDDVTSLCVGEPDYLPPPAVLDAVIAAVKSGQTRYTAVTGTLELRQAIAQDLQRRKHVTYNPTTEIVVGNGAKQCVLQGIMSVAGVGDQVLVPAPHWPYPDMVKLTGALPVILPTRAQEGYLMTPSDLRHTLEQHSAIKLLILCNPSNPTGGVYTTEQLSALATVLNDFPHVKVLSDEIYEWLVYNEKECPCFAAIPGMFDRTITINGFSKSHAMTGLRLGYLAAPAPLAAAASKIQSQFTSCAGSLSQAAGVAALTQVSDDELLKNRRVMKEKRDYVLQRLAAMPHVHVHVPPQGAFYVLPDVSAYLSNDKDDIALCQDLLQQQKLALVPGTAFGAPGTVRISYATSMEELTTAMNKLEAYLLTVKAQEANME